MRNFLSFLTSRIFIINIFAAVAFIVLSLGFTYKWLDSYTRHGSSVSVPDLRGMQLEELDEFLLFRNLRYKISDSTVFDLSLPPETVIEQDPHPNEKVKENRTIYLSITRTSAPGVKIPHLADNSLRQAEAILKSYGLVTGQLIYKPDLAKNAVLEMQINGRVVEQGEEVPKGTVIDLVLGDGFGNTKVAVPNLYNLKLDEATFVIKASSLNLGALIFDATVKDTIAARVYKQFPTYDPEVNISQGESVDLYLTQSESILILHDPEYKNNNEDE